MKANEAPEKLYLHPTAKGEVGASWLTFPLTDNDIEYTRTDAFIENACRWIMNNFPTNSGISAMMYADDFRKEMEGQLWQDGV